jgi:flagellar biosynthesis/type III secretory pathway protein FliH
MFTNLKLAAAAAVALALVVVLAYQGYNHIFQLGYQQAQLACNLEKEQYKQELAQKVVELEQELENVANTSNQQKQQLTKTINNLAIKLKTQQVVTIKNGECVPATVFIDSINQAISEANLK